MIIQEVTTLPTRGYQGKCYENYAGIKKHFFYSTLYSWNSL